MFIGEQLLQQEGWNNQQYFCPSTVVLLPVELGVFNSNCTVHEEVFNWTTISEKDFDYFTLEYSYDNFVFQPAGTADAVGNSLTTQYYSYSVARSNDKQKYYRLKMVDKDGEFKYTEIIASQNCDDIQLIKQIEQNENHLVINTNRNAKIQIINQIGEIIFNEITINNKCALDKGPISTGLYFIQAVDENGTQEIRKEIVFE